MLVSTIQLLQQARRDGYAVGAFNIYSLEGVRSVTMAAIQQRLAIPLVLHGTSGLPDDTIRRTITLGVCKSNLNTELGEAGLQAAQGYLSTSAKKEPIELMEAVIRAMQVPVMAKFRLFGSTGRAASFASDDTADAIHNNPRRRTP